MEKVCNDMPQFVPLKNDLMFKYIFGYQKNARFIIDLLEEFFINATSEKEILKIIKNDKTMEEAYDQMKSFRKNEYWGNDFFHPSKLIKEQAEDEGFEKGMEKGVVETAKNMIMLNLDVDTISKATGLSVEKIEQLKNSN